MQMKKLKNKMKVRLNIAKKDSGFTFMMINPSMKAAGSITRDMVKAR